MRAPRLLAPITPGALRAVVFLFALTFTLSATAYLAAVGYYHREQAAQQRQGAVLEQRLCTTLRHLAARRPPAGAPAGDPARAYLLWQWRVLAELGPDVGCRP